MDLTDNSDDGVPGEIAITAPVGINGRNLAADVHVIQQALNDVPPDQGRPVPSLKVDGICGEKTRKAIQMFQLKHFGWRLADGRVDPLKQTIAKLNELVGGAAPFISGPGTVRIAQGVARVPRIIGLLNRAFDCIRAARNNLILAQQVVDQADIPAPSIGASRAVKMEQVNRHFDVDTYPKPARHGVVHQLSRTFDMMLGVFTRPGGLWGKAIFDLDPLNKDYVAYTYPQGYHRSGVKKTEKGKEIRIDSIYLCDGIDTVLDDECVLVIIHELSHFVAFPQRIRDFAYGWYDQPKMKRLVPWQKLHNAMNHCNFAWDAKYGHERKPQGLD
jgi:Putative peptidoglycan binding domain